MTPVMSIMCLRQANKENKLLTTVANSSSEIHWSLD